MTQNGRHRPKRAANRKMETAIESTKAVNASRRDLIAAISIQTMDPSKNGGIGAIISSTDDGIKA